MVDPNHPEFDRPNVSGEHTQAELLQLYDYLIDTYGVSSQHEQADYLWERPEMPKLTGWAALKATFVGDKRPLPTRPTYMETEQSVEMPMLPARNPHDSRHGVLFRRHSTYRGESTQILFKNWTERSETEAEARRLPMHAKDPRGYRALGSISDQSAEYGSQWFDYLTKVKEYRDSGEYERSGYGPFVEQNWNLIAAMEAAMDFTEDDREVRRDARAQFEQEQSALSRELIDHFLGDIPYSEWRNVPNWYEDRSLEYNARSKTVTIKSLDQSTLPSLNVLVSQTDKDLSSGARYKGIYTRYYFEFIEEGEAVDTVTLRVVLDDNFGLSDTYENRDIKDKQTLLDKVVPSFVSEEIVQSLQDQMKRIEFPAPGNTDMLFMQTVWNEIMKKYRDAEERGAVIRVVNG